jgi:hypothetical protein
MVHYYNYYVSGHYLWSCFYLRYRPVYISKQNVSETGFSLRLQVKPTESGSSAMEWAHLRRFYLKTETEFSLRNVLFWNINRTVFWIKTGRWDNVQKHNICTKYTRNKLKLVVIQGSGTNIRNSGCSEKHVGFYCIRCSVEYGSKHLDAKPFRPFRWHVMMSAWEKTACWDNLSWYLVIWHKIKGNLIFPMLN